ncbi:MAG: Amino acid/amide transporter rane protein 1, family [Frankiales bacterium]|nr:Amino acid/amide transporter rane protein 1, family [Frankiales bacterium]
MDVSLVVDTLKLASVYAMLAVGFVIVYRTSRVLNLTQPGVVLLGGLLALSLLPATGGSGGARFWLVAVGLVALGAVAGFALYGLLLRPMAGQSRISQVLMTLAALFLLEAVAEAGWRGQSSFLPMPGKETSWEILGAHVRLLDVVPIGVTAVVFAGLGLFYRFSPSGVQMRAVAENPALAARRGINIERIGALAWGLASALGVLAMFLATTQGSVSPLLVGTALKGFTVALVAGLDSIGGLLPAALLVAVAEVLTVRFLDQQLGEAVPYVVLLGVLLVKPWGLAGTREELDRV